MITYLMINQNNKKPKTKDCAIEGLQPLEERSRAGFTFGSKKQKSAVFHLGLVCLL
jgi:hypothetical protein